MNIVKCVVNLRGCDVLVCDIFVLHYLDPSCNFYEVQMGIVEENVSLRIL
jgi:hypothetical protein